ncbi:major facilitator superfamily domain-containing protein [Massariosphaeria phaeospora]|uniref:Major facilitator superfamily domain-containing protein n=1 Tax=Massariosphaeria phaeospora TaxID=100035 RepID=A0A7C8IAP3_9PLEO|nr:major facilitator superfamily domain-containing protein [Massariosphaeria phaeospora]
MEYLEDGKEALANSADPTLIEHHGHELSNERRIVEDDGPSQEHPLKKPLAFHMSFLALLIMGFICALDATVLGVAIPSIAYELHGTSLEGFWASISFILAVVIVQPIHTSVSNVFGRLLPLYASFVLFMIGSIVFAVAQDMTVLIVGRVLQGLGAGGLDVLNEIILADITTLKERPMYLGIFAIPMLGGTVLGPVTGGLFAEYASWRWIGWINLPISTIGLALAILFLRLKPLEQPLSQKLRRLDWIGLALFTAGCTLFASPIAWAGAMFPWASYQTLVPLLLGFGLLVVFGLFESKPVEPAFPYRIFKNRTACMTLAAGFLHGIANYIIMLYVPLFLQAVYLHSPLRAAVLTLPGCFLAIGSAVIGSVVVEVMRTYRATILASWVFVAVGAGLLTLLDRSSSLAAKESFQVVLGLGLGPFWSVLNLPLQASMLNVDDMGLATGILVSFRLFGGLIGLALSSSIFNTVYTRKIEALGVFPPELAFLGDAREAVASIHLLREIDIPAELLDRVIDAYKISIYGVFWMIAGAGVAGFVISCLIKEISLEREDLGRQQLEGNTKAPDVSTSSR